MVPAIDPDTTDAALPRVTLVIGGARSGKSVFAEAMLDGRFGERIYLATAQARDAEMAARIAAHRRRRGAGWTTVEEPIELVTALEAHAQPAAAVLVDCLTLWLANLIEAGHDLDAQTKRLARLLPALKGPAVLVTNEVGLGLVPETALGRRFRDEAGRLNQTIAASADRVVLMTAGLPLVLKDGSDTP